MKRIAYCLFLLILLEGTFCNAQTHFACKDGKGGGEIYRYTNTGPNILLFTKKLPLKSIIKFTESKKNKMLLYIEKAKDYLKSYYSNPFALEDMAKHSKEFILLRGPYQPDLILYNLHVCDSKGEDKYVIPIEQKYGKFFSHGLFYGETVVGLQFNIRKGGRLWETFVNLKTGEKLTLVEAIGNQQAFSASISPDETKFLCQDTDSGLRCSLIYLNGKQILPFYDDDPRRGSISSEQYFKKQAQIASWLKLHKDNFIYGSLTENIWSEDSRYFALLQYSYGEAEEENSQEINTPKIVIVDTDKIREGLDYRDYTQILPVDIEPDRLRYISVYLYWNAETESIDIIAQSKKSLIHKVLLKE